MSSPRVAVVFPPAADPSLPYGALPLLGSVLRRAGYEAVSLRDVNLEVFDALLRDTVLEDQLDRPAAASLMGPATAAEVVGGIAEARRVLRDPVDFYDPAKLLYAKRIFRLGGELLTAGHPELSFGKYSYSSHPYDSYPQVAAAVADAGPLGEHLRTVVAPSLVAERPDVIGLSVPYFSQLIPAFMLAEAVRELAPDVHITFGGPVVTWGKDVLTADPRFSRWLDSFFVGEADETFLHFVEALDGKRDVTSVANLVRYVDGRVVDQLDPAYQLNLDWLPTPDFSLLPLDDYFAPKRVICLVPTRGCYFNKCAFCNYAFIKIAPYRMRSAKHLAEDVATIQEATGEDVFCFESDVILPRHLREISEALVDKQLDVRWHAVARFEKGFDDELFATMRRAGCVRIYMGLESANDRVLKAMVKGTDSRRMSDILAMSHKAGIAIEAGVFSEFPSETAEEAEDTYRFIRDHQHVITRADVGTFRLLKGAPIAEKPELYGITLRDDPGQRWYHLDFDDPTPRDTPAARAIERIQQLYPEVALIDVPDDILYTARWRPGVFHDFFGDPEQVTDAERLADGTSLRLAEGVQLQRVVISNSGAVHYDDGKRPVFEASQMSITIAVDRDRRRVVPLGDAQASVLRLVEAGQTSTAQLRAAVSEAGGASGLLEQLVTHGLLEVSRLATTPADPAVGAAP